MPKWLSSLLITIGFLALIVLAFMPGYVEVNVTTNNVAYSSSSSHKTVNHNGPVALGQLKDAADENEQEESDSN